MTKKRPNYSTEFQQEAARLVLDKNYPIAEACNAMGVGMTAIRRWVKQLEILPWRHYPHGQEP